MLRDKMIDRFVDELDKEILDLQALREELSGEQVDEAVRTLTDPDYQAGLGTSVMVSGQDEKRQG